MKKEEKQLFRQLCSFREEFFDGDLLKYASPEVLGHLFFNRMQGAAYGVLRKHECLGRVNREFRNSLKEAYEQNIEKNKSFMQCVALVSEALQAHSGRYAMLKGALLCGAYPAGYRTSNDIDLLVSPEDITLIGDTLKECGFAQGNIRGGEFVPAGRKEIIESKLLRGETVPYILEIGLPKMRFLEVDVNFSLDYKNSNGSVLDAMLGRITDVENKGIRVSSFNKSDFFIHLCCHLYKEAATLPWVEMHRDMTMYKYADIYMLLDQMGKTGIAELFDRAKGLGLEKLCAFAILQTAALFSVKSEEAKRAAEGILRNDSGFLHRVVAPSEKKSYIYKTKDIEERFFMRDRIADLEEMKHI